jgi:hypothetical protein
MSATLERQEISTAETTPPLTELEATSKLTELYAGMIGLTIQETDTIGSKIDEAAILWSGINKAHFRSDGFEGSIDKRSLRMAWGSLPGLSLEVEIQTKSGSRNRLYSQPPLRRLFEISPPKEILPVRADYALRPLQEGFDWQDIVNYYGGKQTMNPATPLYLVAFRSKSCLKPTKGY